MLRHQFIDLYQRSLGLADTIEQLHLDTQGVVRSAELIEANLAIIERLTINTKRRIRTDDRCSLIENRYWPAGQSKDTATAAEIKFTRGVITAADNTDVVVTGSNTLRPIAGWEFIKVLIPFLANMSSLVAKAIGVRTLSP